MKISITFFFVLFAMLLSTCLTADDFNPYIGAEAQLRHMSFHKNYGGNILKHNSPQRNFYAGIRPLENFGIELGYEATNARTNTAILQAGDIVNGAQIPKSFSSVIFKSKSKFKGPHFSAIGFYEPYKDMPLEIFGSIGLSFLKGSIERHTENINGISFNTIRIMSHRRPILRAMAGTQYLWNNHLGTRISMGLSKTSQMNICANDGICSSVLPTTKPKDSIIYGYGLGMFYKF